MTLGEAERVWATLLAQKPVPRQVRTLAKLSSLTIEQTNAALRLLAERGKAERNEHGLWVST